MRTLDRYISLTLLKGSGIVLAVLLIMFSFLALLQELEDVGDGNYGLIDALAYVGLTLPERILELAPVTALLGGLVGLGTLAKGSELIAIRTAGVSINRFAWAVGKLSIALIVALLLFAEFVAPPLHQLAEKNRLLATQATEYLSKGKGFWARDEYQVLRVHTMQHGRIPTTIELYEFNNDGKLRSYVHAARADVRDSREWQLEDVHQKIITDDMIVSQKRANMKWHSFLKKGQLEGLQLPISSLAPSDLYQYVQYLKDTEQKSNNYELTFWHEVSLPLSAGAMAILAVPFGFGSLRNPSFGQQLALGAGVGILFFLLDQIVANLGLLFSVSAPLVAFIPVVAILGFTAFLLRRVQ